MYGIGTQLKPKYMDFIVFYNIPMIDYDSKNLNKLLLSLDKVNESFYVYNTKNGYHAFCVSSKIKHNSEDMIKLLKKCECDPWYIKFSYKYGFKVRTNLKTDENPGLVYVMNKGNIIKSSVLLLKKMEKLFR